MGMMFEDVIECDSGHGYKHELCDVYFIDKGTTQSEAASKWLERHGIDPGWIADDSLVTRNEINHTITYSRIIFGCDPAGDENDVLIVGSYSVKDQNEAGPWPYPEEMKPDDYRRGDDQEAAQKEGSGSSEGESGAEVHYRITTSNS